MFKKAISHDDLNTIWKDTVRGKTNREGENSIWVDNCETSSKVFF